MDNLTHTLIGVLVSETCARFVPPSRSGLPEPSRRAAGTVLMGVGSNLPDADFLYSLLTGNKLDYLLQHRGHTHTIVGALVIAAGLFVAARVCLRVLRRPLSLPDLSYLAALALLTPLLHIAMDFTNSYGVHPFWPAYNGWLYGDAVFIMEPLLWIAGTPLIFVLQSGWARVLVAVAVAGAAGLSFGSGLVPIFFAFALSFVLLALAAVAHFCRQRTALVAGIAAWLGITLMFSIAGGLARAQTDTLLADRFPREVTLDRVLTPLPVNPACWELVSAHLEGDTYTVRKAMLSLAPGWLPANRCPGRGLDTPTTAPLSMIDLRSTPQVHWLGQMSMNRGMLAQAAGSSCRAAALMQFARIPWIAQQGNRTLLGDLRYDREPGLGFAEVDLNARGPRCPTLPAPWLRPRADLLDR